MPYEFSCIFYQWTIAKSILSWNFRDHFIYFIAPNSLNLLLFMKIPLQRNLIILSISCFMSIEIKWKHSNKIKLHFLFHHGMSYSKKFLQWEIYNSYFKFCKQNAKIDTSLNVMSIFNDMASLLIITYMKIDILCY